MNFGRKSYERLTCHYYLVNRLGKEKQMLQRRMRSSKIKPQSGNFEDILIPPTFLNLKSHLPMLLSKVDEETRYEKTSSGQIIVYTDGSCLFNNQLDTSLRKGGIGVYWGSDNHPLNLSIPHGGNKLSNNRAEIASAHAAILIARFAKIKCLCLRTDSKILVDSFTSWLPQWKETNWVSMSTGRPIKNQDMLKKLSRELKYLTVEFEHCSDNVEGIQKAHVLAQNGANLT